MKKNKLNLLLDCKAIAQKNTLLKNAQANAESNFFKRVFFSPPKKSARPFFTNLFFPPHGFKVNTTICMSNVNSFGQSVCGLQTTNLQTDSRAADNKVLPQWGLMCFYETLVCKQTVVLLLNICANNPPLRQYPNRYVPFQDDRVKQ